MNFSFTQEQEMLRDVLGRYLREDYDFDTRRERLLLGNGRDTNLWSDLAERLGILGAAMPVEVGGLGGSAIETMIVMEELGRALVTEPYLESIVIGGGLLQAAGGKQATALLRQITSGAAKLAFASGEPTSRYAPENVKTRATRCADGWRLNGTKSVVAAAPQADWLLVTARTSGDDRDLQGISLFLVDPGTSGVKLRPYRLIDDRLAADVELFEAVVPDEALLGTEGKALPIITEVMDRAIAALSAEAVGIMRRMLSDTIDYTRQRQQFGQPLAAFQVLRHRMVDMYMAVEQAVSATYLATLKLDADPATRGRAASAAKTTIGNAVRFVSQNAVQLHGAMGMTDELPVGHFFRRAAVIEHQFGSPDHHIARYAALAKAA